MKLLIGENIRRLRRERGLTQEEMGAHLGISFQSISKWERGDGYPDITALPSIANYFNVSVDDLLGADEIVRTKKYDEINQTWEENNKNSLNLENALAYLLRGEEKRNAAKEAIEPLMWTVKHQLSVLADVENDNAYLEKAEEICNILKSCK